MLVWSAAHGVTTTLEISFFYNVHVERLTLQITDVVTIPLQPICSKGDKFVYSDTLYDWIPSLEVSTERESRATKQHMNESKSKFRNVYNPFIR